MLGIDLLKNIGKVLNYELKEKVYLIIIY